MTEFARRKRGVPALVACLLLGLVAPTAFAQREEEEEIPIPTEPDMKVSATIDYSLNTHFISYGLDVWGGGNDFCCNDATMNPSAEVAFDLAPFTIYGGTWWDVNDNAPPSIGGDLQEVDVWIGTAYDWENFTFSTTYQAWLYGGGTEQIFDLAIGYDDTEFWGDSGMVALNPSILFHKRLSSTNITSPPSGTENGWVIVLGIEPSFTVLESEDYPVTLSIPVALGLFLEDGFHGTKSDGTTTDAGFGYVSIGATASVPLSFIPSQYGEWSLNANVTYWFTDDDTIANPDESFLTGMLGLTLTF